MDIDEALSGVWHADSLRVEIEKIVWFAFIRDIDMAIDIYIDIDVDLDGKIRLTNG